MSITDSDRIALETGAIQPFDGEWCEWHNRDSGIVVTFITMKHLLYTVWVDQCLDYEDGHMAIDHTRFSTEQLTPPGIHRREDREVYGDECYQVIVPYESLSETLCRRYIRRLNARFDRAFVLR